MSHKGPCHQQVHQPCDSTHQLQQPMNTLVADGSRAELLFNKKFSYNPSPEWTFEPFSSVGSSDRSSGKVQSALEKLASLKSTLNNLKDNLSDKDIVKWHEHTNFTNLAGGVIQACRQRFHPELCTQAWCKFYEILSSYPLICIHDDQLVTAHLCEAPGAFITSLNHYLCSQGFMGTWLWRASTLNPYNEGNPLGHMIDDDRFLRHSLEFWDFGVDNTGDLFSVSNREKLKESMSQLGPVQLVTADGSIDCQNVPGEQETVVSPLHYCEVLTALEILAEGGSFVIKLFTMFEYSTVCLMYILNTVFQQVNVFKPATSKSGNSEVYVVCLQYKGNNSIPQDIWSFLRGGLASSDFVCQVDLPESFLSQQIECCHQFMMYQGEVIQENLNLFGNMNEELVNYIQFLRNSCTEMYIERYDLQRICFHDKVGRYPKKKSKDPNAWAKGVYQKEPGHFKQEGTFRDRNSQSLIPWRERLAQFTTPALEIGETLSHYIQHGENNPLLTMQDVHVTTGKALSWIRSSRFCDNTLLAEFQDVVSNAQLQRHFTENEDATVQRSVECLGKVLGAVYPTFPMEPIYIYDLSPIPSECLACLQNKYQGQIVQIPSTLCQDMPSVFVYIDVTSGREIGQPGSHELASQVSLTQTLVKIFQNLSLGSMVVFRLSTVLTRYTAGLLYILYHSFNVVALETSGSFLMDQFLVCSGFEGSPQWCCDHLIKCFQSDQGENSHVLEIIPVVEMLSDDQFVGFLRRGNQRLIKSFISLVIGYEKAIYGQSS